jgi:hypothetical protein
MKAAKIVGILFLVYVAVVAIFESLLGYYQPAGGTTIVITTTGDDGEPKDRVVSRLESGGQLYVAANHWPRAWYNTVLEHPDVTVTIDGEKKAYRAVPVSAEEHARVDADKPLGLGFRILTGFPPRRFVRLDPV